MIITEDKTKVSRVGEMEEVTFSIKATSKALKILTSNMYSNPVRAVIQELSQNSGDSMLMARKGDKPFSVTLPNTFHPHLVVSDNGVGMSHDFMMKHYTKVFESTKDKSNEQNGAMGLGRLSALALSDAYTVTCWDGQERREYSIFFNERGIPTIALLVDEKDDHEKGVEVKVPVPRNLHNQFQQEAAEHVYRFYKVKPIITGGSNWEGFEEIEYKLISDDGLWSFPKQEGVAIAVMGVYHFPIDANSITKITDEQRALIDSGIVLHVPLGDMDTSSNRESLYYNDKTNATLKKLLDKAQKEVSTFIQRDFDKAPNMIAAKQLFFDYFKYGGIANKIGRILGEKPVVHYKGATITEPTLELTDGTTAHSFVSGFRRYNRIVVKNEFKEDILLSKQAKVFEADSRYGARIKFLVKSHDNTGDRDLFVVVLTFKDAAAKALFYKKNDIESTFNFDLTSSLPKPPRGSSGNSRKAEIYKFNEKGAKEKHYIRSGRHSNSSYFWSDVMEEDDDENEAPASFEDIDEEKPVYITIERFVPNGFTHRVGNLAECLATLRKLDKTFPHIYGIRPSSVEKAKKAGWISLADASRPIFDEYFKNNQGFQHVDTNVFSNYIEKSITHIMPDLQKLIAEAESINNNNGPIARMEDYARCIFSIKYQIPPRLKSDIAKNLNQSKKMIDAKYPLLSRIIGHYNFDKNDAEHYINLVNAAEGV